MHLVFRKNWKQFLSSQRCVVHLNAKSFFSFANPGIHLLDMGDTRICVLLTSRGRFTKYRSNEVAPRKFHGERISRSSPARIETISFQISAYPRIRVFDRFKIARGNLVFKFADFLPPYPRSYGTLRVLSRDIIRAPTVKVNYAPRHIFSASNPTLVIRITIRAIFQTIDSYVMIRHEEFSYRVNSCIEFAASRLRKYCAKGILPAQMEN